MSVTPAIADAGGFVPEIWANRGLDLLKPLLPVTRRVAKDAKFSDAFNVGDVLNIDVPGRFNAPKKATTTAVTTQAPRGMTKVALTLNTHRCTDFSVYDVTSAQANTRLMDSLMKSAIAGMARAIEQDTIAVLMQGANNNGSAGTDITGATWRTAMTALNNRLIPSEGRNFVLTPKDFSAALADSELKGYFENLSEATLRKAELGMIYGFDTFMSQLAPQTAVQRIVMTGGTAAETFRLIFNGFETADIAHHATAATLATNIQTALQAMTEPIAMTGLASASGSGTGPWQIDVTFSGAALRFPSVLTGSVEGVAGTPYAGTIAVANTGTVTSTNLAFHEDAAIFAPRAFRPIPAEAGVLITQVTDDDPDTGTGITLRLLGQYDMANRAYRIGLDILYGVTALRGESLQRVLA